MASYAKCIIGSGTLTVRSTASTSGSSLGSIMKNDVVEVLSTTTDSSGYTWYNVKVRTTAGSTKTGYVCKQNANGTYMSAVTNNSGTAGTVKGSSGTVYVRTGPATTHTQYYSLPIGATLTVHEQYNTWWIVSTASGLGCMHPDYVNATGGGTSPGTGTFPTGNIGKTAANNVTIYNSAAVSNSNMGRFPAGCKFIIEGVDGSFVRVKFGTKNGTTVSRWISTSDFENVGTPTSGAKNRMCEIGQSLIGLSGPNLGLGGDYCQNFIYWLAGASSLSPVNLPYGSGYCSDALSWFNSRNEYFLRGAKSPQKGDLVFYRTSGYTDVAHVGLVYAVDANYCYSVEGNINGGYVGTAWGGLNTGSCSHSGKYVLGFARPSI